MERPIEKFGSVYLGKLDKDGKDISSPLKLEGIRFSNWDHQWYNKNVKSIHPDFSTHHGKRFYAEIKLKTRNVQSDTDEFYTGRLLLPFGLGENPVPDLESIHKQDCDLLEFLQKLGFIQGPEDPTAIRLAKFHSAAFVCFIISGRKLSDFQGLLHFFPIALSFDDFLEKHKFYSYYELNVVKHAFHEILNGRDVDWSKEKLKIRELKPEKEDNYFIKILSYMRTHSKIIDEKRGKMGLDSKHLVYRYLECFDSIMLDNCAEWVEKHHEKNPLYRKLQEKLRGVTISAYVWIEFLLFEKGVSLSDEIRNTFLVKRFFEVIGKQTGGINDIFSFYKEMCKGEIGSCLYLLHVTDGLSVEESLEKVFNTTNNYTQEACEIGELLLKLYEGNEEVSQLVEAGKAVMYGHMQWYTYVRRYQLHLVFNCVVQNN